MSGRKYLTHIKSVSILAPIASPENGLSRDGFGHEHFRFFLQEGWFCIESKKSGRVVDVPPAQVRTRVWFNQAELEALAETERKAKEAAESALAAHADNS